jgi:hypothetical protein
MPRDHGARLRAMGRVKFSVRFGLRFALTREVKVMSRLFTVEIPDDRPAH